MNRHRDIDRTLEGFFLDGPSQMPDRLFMTVLDQVERVPQRRLARLQLRLTDMSTTARWVAASAAAVLVVGVGFAALGRGPAPGPGDSPVTSASPSEATSPSAEADLIMPDTLRHPYLGPVRDVEGLQTRDVSQLEFTARTFAYRTGVASSLYSAAGVIGDQIVVRSSSDTPLCDGGDEGRYPFTTSPGGSLLTIEPGTDDCAARGAAMAGTWQRSACRNPDNRCLGEVEPGTYASQYFDPVASTSEEWRASFGRLSYTVPDGWANNDDWPSMYGLMRAASYAAGGVNQGEVAPDTITLLARPSAASLANCAEDPEPGVGTDSEALASWIRTHPGLTVTEGADLVIDGIQAAVLDVAVRDEWSETCDLETPFTAAPVFVGDYHWAVAKGDRMRVVLLDLPGGTTVAITVDPEDPATFEGLVAETLPIIESFDFE
jgi:hypothetical protein